jgi:hypothetical protein
LTAISNDFGYEEIFEKQIKALGNKEVWQWESKLRLTQRPQRSEVAGQGFDSNGIGGPTEVYEEVCHATSP